MEQRLHFIGIGGIGMSAIAKIMLSMGYSISGSDVKSSPLTEALIADGAAIAYCHDAGNIPADCDAVVYSSAVKEDNPEMIEARRRNLVIYRRAEMLAFLISTRLGIGIAGAHGKTTTSGMIATMLEYAGLDPTIIIGGKLPYIGGGNAKPGKGPYLVAEADESDGTFLLLNPTVAVVTNIEGDHLDHYHTLDNIIAAFSQYLRQVPENGFAIVNLDCPHIRKITNDIPGTYITYGIEQDAQFIAKNISTSADGAVLTSADIYHQGLLLGRLELTVPGIHNISNALAAIAFGVHTGLDFDLCSAGLRHFTGTGRRFECLGEEDGVIVIDDYAHHPTEVAATINAAKSLGKNAVTAVFQPHRYSRTQAMYPEFATALMNADKVIVNEIYPAFEAPIPGISAQLIVDRMKELGHSNVNYAATREDAEKILLSEAAPGEIALIMGAGNIRSVGEGFLARKREGR